MEQVNEVVIVDKVDLGDARVETMQAMPEQPMFWDSYVGWYARYGD